MLPREVKINDSSNVKGLGYDPEALVLHVLFVDNALYEYHHVPHSAFGELVSADSVGKYFYAIIRSHYKGERI